MPAILTHYLLAVDVRQKMDHLNFNTNECAFYWGTQGPDFLFFHRAMPLQTGPTLHKLGSLLHKLDPNLIFSAMLRYINGQNDGFEKEVARSYACGFICHYALDSIAHPFVYYNEWAYKKIKKVMYKNIFVHNKIEHNIDVILLKERLGKTIKTFDPMQALPDDQLVLKAMADMMCFVLNQLFSDTKATEKSVYQAFKDTLANAKYLYDPKQKKRRVLCFIERFFRTGPVLSSLIWGEKPDDDWDYANRKKAGWHSLTEPTITRNESFSELFDTASVRAVRMIGSFIQCEKDKTKVEFTNKIGFNNGKLIKRNNKFGRSAIRCRQ